jgi:PAS domain S-box-containing protein
LALAACMALIVAAGAFLSWTLIRDEIEADLAKHLFTLATEVAHEVESDIDAALGTVAGIAGAIPAAALDKPAEIGQYFHQLPTPLGWLSRCAAVAPDGRVMVHSVPAPAGAINSLAGREYFRRVLAEKKPAVSAPLISGVSGMPIIALAAPRLDAEGKVRLVVVCGLVLTQRGVLGHVREIKVGNTGYLYVATRQRKIVLHPDASRMLGDSPPRGANPLADKASDGFEGTEAGANSRGLQALMSFKQIPSLGWFVAAVYPLDEAYQPLQRARERILLMALAALAVSAVLAWFLAAWLVAPLQRLTRHVGVLRDRGADALVHALPRRNDEIGDLSEAFNGLFGELRQREGALRTSEEKFAKAFHSNPDFIMISRQSDGLIVEVNEGFERLTGYRADEVVGRTTIDLRLWADLRDRDEMFRRVAEQGWARDFESRFVVKGGEVRNVLVSATAIELAGVPHLIGTTHDITELKRSQERLHESEERFSKAFHANPDYITISRLSDGLILNANESFERISGWRIEEAIGRTSLELGVWADPEERQRLTELLRADGAVQGFEFDLRTKSGELRRGVVSAETVDIDGEKCLIGIVRDITDLRRAEDGLRRSEERFVTLFRNNPDYTTLSRLSDGQFVDVNHAFEEMTGWRREEVIGRTAKDIGLYADISEREWLVGELQVHGAVRDFVFHFRMRSGDIRLVQGAVVKVDIEGEPHILGVARDITNIWRAEAALKKSEEKFAKAFHASPDWIVVVRMQDGLILDANEGFARISGYSIEEAVGRTVEELGIWAHPEKRAEFVRNLRATGRVSEYEWEFCRKGGAIRDGLIASVAIELDGEPCLISIVRDITEQRRAEEEIRNLNVALESRVSARTAELEGIVQEMESFSYSISHDLRSPLRAIAGYARIIEEDYAARLDAEGNRLLRRIVSGAIRMSDLIDDLLDFSRIGRTALKKVPIDMAALVREVLSEMPEAGSGHNVQMRIGALPAVMADRSLMRQVWVNLLSNAIKYSRPRDPVVIEIGGSVDGAEVHFHVRDNGTGFDMQYADKLFQVFQRLHRDPAFEGTGVGLAIVARIVQRHGGRVWAEAEPEKGATFHFTLPASTLA